MCTITFSDTSYISALMSVMTQGKETDIRLEFKEDGVYSLASCVTAGMLLEAFFDGDKLFSYQMLIPSSVTMYANLKSLQDLLKCGPKEYVILDVPGQHPANYVVKVAEMEGKKLKVKHMHKKDVVNVENELQRIPHYETVPIYVCPREFETACNTLKKAGCDGVTLIVQKEDLIMTSSLGSEASTYRIKMLNNDQHSTDNTSAKSGKKNQKKRKHESEEEVSGESDDRNQINGESADGVVIKKGKLKKGADANASKTKHKVVDIVMESKRALEGLDEGEPAAAAAYSTTTLCSIAAMSKVSSKLGIVIDEDANLVLHFIMEGGSGYVKAAIGPRA